MGITPNVAAVVPCHLSSVHLLCCPLFPLPLPRSGFVDEEGRLAAVGEGLGATDSYMLHAACCMGGLHRAPPVLLT